MVISKKYSKKGKPAPKTVNPYFHKIHDGNSTFTFQIQPLEINKLKIFWFQHLIHALVWTPPSRE